LRRRPIDLGSRTRPGADPAFTAAYRALLDQLDSAEADTAAIYDALDALRSGIAVTNDYLEAGSEAEADA